MEHLHDHMTNKIMEHIKQFRIPNILVVKCDNNDVDDVIKAMKTRVCISAYVAYLHKELKESSSLTDLLRDVSEKKFMAQLDGGKLLCTIDCHHFKTEGEEPFAELTQLFKIDADFVFMISEEDTPANTNISRMIRRSAVAAERICNIVYFGENKNTDAKKYIVSISDIPSKKTRKIRKIIRKYSGDQNFVLSYPLNYPIKVSVDSFDKGDRLIDKLNHLGVISYIAQKFEEPSE